MTPENNNKVLHCVVVAPEGKLLDCKTTSVIFPAHDGQAGVLRNHMPMLCRLGLGIMEVKSYNPDRNWNGREFLLIDRGFAMIVSNELTVIGYEAISFKDMPADRIERILEKAQKKFDTGTYTPEQQLHEKKKLALMTRLAKLCGSAVT